MESRAARLKRIVRLQEQIRSLHQTRHSTHLANANAAGREASELLEALNAASPLPGLFPDLYNRRITAAIDRHERENEHARAAAARVATETARSNIVERAYRDAMRLEERSAAEKEGLEAIERDLSERK